MINKKFLIPILALVACVLPVAAQQEYCAGTSPNCSAFSLTAFNTVVTADSPTGLLGFSNSLGVLSGDTYTDDLTGIVYVDYTGGSPNGALSYSAGTLTSPANAGSSYDLQITVPAEYLAVSFNINIPHGLCDNYCAEGQTTGFVGFVNTGNLSAPWVINLGPLGPGGVTDVVNFDAYSSAAQPADTPEVATLFLIGAGLIAMRLMNRARLSFFRAPQPA